MSDINHSPERTAQMKKYCRLCNMNSPDMRLLQVDCCVDMTRVIPEFVPVGPSDSANTPQVLTGYGMEVCRTCRECFLTAMKKFADERRKMRDFPIHKNDR